MQSPNPLRAESTGTLNGISRPLAERNQMIEQAAQFAKHEEWDRASTAAAAALKIQREQIGAETEDACLIAEQITTWQERAGNFTAANATLQELLPLSVHLRGAEHPRTLFVKANAMSDAVAARLGIESQKQLAKATALCFDSDRLFSAGQFSEAREKASDSLTVRRKLLGPDDVFTAASLHAVSVADLALGDLKSACTGLECCAGLREKLLGLANAGTLASLVNLAIVYARLDDVANATKTREKVLQGATLLYGPNHLFTMQALVEVANCYVEQNEYKQAETAFKEAVSRQRTVLGDKHLEIARTLGRLGMLYLKTSNYVAAQECLQQSFNLFRELCGPSHPNTAQALITLAVCEKLQGNFSDAVMHLRSAVDILTHSLGETHADTLDAMHTLANVLSSMGNCAQSECIYRHVLQNYIELLGDKEPQVGAIELELGELYCSWSDFGNAEKCFDRALKNFELTRGKSHPDTLAVVVALATVNARLGRFELAERQCQDASNTLIAALGPDTPQSIGIELALSNIFILEKKYDVAESQLRLVLARQSTNSSAERYRRAITLEKLAGVALRAGKYADAASRAKEVLQIYRETLPDDHPREIDSLLLAGIAEHALHHEAEAKQFADQAIAAARLQIETASTAQSERQQLALNFRLREILDLELSLPCEVGSVDEGYRHVLAWKGAIAARQIKNRHHDPQTTVLFETLKRTCSDLVTLEFQVPDQQMRSSWLEQIDRLKQQKEEIEAELSRQNSDAAGQSSRSVTSEPLRSILPPKTALVDIIEYVAFAGGREQEAPDEQRYVAFIVRRDQPIIRVELGAAKRIDDAVDRWRREGLFDVVPKPDGSAVALRNLVWEPLQSHLDGCQTVLVSPDTALSQVAFGALPGEEPGNYLLEELAVAAIPIPQMLPQLLALRRQDSPADKEQLEKMLIIGNIDYDSAVGRTNNSPQSTDTASHVEGGELLTFAPLKSAADELNSLQRLYRQQFPAGNLQVLEGAGATESAFCREAPLCHSLLIATHGFSAPPNLRSALAVQDEMVGLNPNHVASRWGSLTGLAMAGANLPPGLGEDDGILTADEVAAVDLSQVHLAFLSGCETALGEKASGEGMLGLQRAFQVAGVKTTIASLWNVPDQKTTQLAERFYKNLWQKKMSKLESLREAQIWLMHSPKTAASEKQEVTDSPGSLPPYAWAAFVLSGDWR